MQAASLCRSDLIAFSDQDDVWYDDKIEMCVRRFDEPDILLVYHDADVVADDGTKLGSLEQFAASNPTIEPMSADPLSFSLGFTQIFRAGPAATFASMEIVEGPSLTTTNQWRMINGSTFLATVLGKIGYLKEPSGRICSARDEHLRPQRKAPRRQLRSDLRSPLESFHGIPPAMNIRATILDAVSDSVDGANPNEPKSELTAIED